jgi:hypothetical protein
MRSIFTRMASDQDSVELAVLRGLATGGLPGKDLLNAELRCLAAEGLIDLAEPLPRLRSQGRLLLQVASGECAQPMD